MKIDVEVCGCRYTVTVSQVSGQVDRYRLVFDSREWIVDAVQIDSSRLSLVLLKDGSNPGGVSHDLGVHEFGTRGRIDVSIGAAAFRTVVDGRRFQHSASIETDGPAGEERVVAPMPGQIVRVLVSEGDQVVEGQRLVVVEAMKMENELCAKRGGQVKQVVVREGQSVEVGRLLVVVE